MNYIEELFARQGALLRAVRVPATTSPRQGRERRIPTLPQPYSADRRRGTRHSACCRPW